MSGYNWAEGRPIASVPARSHAGREAARRRGRSTTPWGGKLGHAAAGITTASGGRRIERWITEAAQPSPPGTTPRGLWARYVHGCMMAVERRRSGRYFYRKEWRDGRCVSVYCGSADSWRGQALFEADQLRQGERYLAREDAKAAARREAGQDARIRDFCKGVDQIVRSALEAAGYHRHDRGEWRKRRMGGSTEMATTTGPAAPTGAATFRELATVAR